MTAEPVTESQSRFLQFWRSMRLTLISALFVVGTTFVLLFPQISARQPYNLNLGDVAPEDIQAPAEIEYVSQIETEAARNAASAGVDDIYDPPNATIGRQQVLRAQQILNFVADVRADPYASSELKQAYLGAITALTLSPEEMTELLAIPDTQYELLESEVVGLIEEAMSGTVKEGNVSEVTSRLELKVSPEVPEDLVPLIVGLAGDLIVPNSVLNVAATEAAREEAVSGIPDIYNTFQRGEVVVRAGERVDELDLEALQALGLAVRRLSWRDVASALLLAIVSVVLLVMYLSTFQNEWVAQPGRLLMIVVLVLAFLVAGQIMLPADALVAYLFPAAALVLALTALIGVEFGVLVTIVLALLGGYMANASLEVTAFIAASSLLAAGSLRSLTRLNAYFLAGLAAMVGELAVLLAFDLPQAPDPAFIAQLLLVAAINGLLSAGLALMILFVIGNLTGIATSLKLLDLLRPDHPLQRRLQQEALGTYQHTLSVSNLVEAAAEAIGADSLLARVGTLYHDIGKMQNPGFFIENRAEGAPDPHAGLSPRASARVIKAHVSDGIDLAQRYRLPPRVVDFIAEHHGTMPILYFLHQAREEAERAGIELDETPFYYDGPTPQSPETAILMLSDGCESATRANRPATGEEIEEIVTRIIQQRLDANQLDDSGLTLTQLKIIRDSIIRTLKGMYHPRVRYPGDKEPEIEEGQAIGELPPGAERDVATVSELHAIADEEDVSEELQMAAERAEEPQPDAKPSAVDKGDIAASS